MERSCRHWHLVDEEPSIDGKKLESSGEVEILGEIAVIGQYFLALA